MKFKVILLFFALLFVAFAHAYAVAQPTQDALVAAWERVQREDPETVAFEKTGERAYRFKTGRFPFDGELRLLKATVDDSMAGDEYGVTTGVIEFDLVGLSDEVVKKYEHSYEAWARTNRLYLDKDARTWVSFDEHFAKVRARANEALREQGAGEGVAGQAGWRGQGRPSWELMTSLVLTWLPVVLLVAMWFWVMKGSGVNRQREYMNHAALHMQNVEDLLARIADAMERNATARADERPRAAEAREA